METLLREKSLAPRLNAAEPQLNGNAFNAETPRTQRAADFFFNHGWTRINTDKGETRISRIDANSVGDNSRNSCQALCSPLSYPCESVSSRGKNLLRKEQCHEIALLRRRGAKIGTVWWGEAADEPNFWWGRMASCVHLLGRTSRRDVPTFRLARIGLRLASARQALAPPKGAKCITI
jgi:hypothetical protein